MTLFANRLDDAIANVTLGQGPGVFPGVGFVAAGGQYRQRRNLDAIKVRGVELDGRIDLDRWSLSGGYSFVESAGRGEGRRGAARRAAPGADPAPQPRLDARLAQPEGDRRVADDALHEQPVRG